MMRSCRLLTGVMVILTLGMFSSLSPLGAQPKSVPAPPPPRPLPSVNKTSEAPGVETNPEKSTGRIRPKYREESPRFVVSPVPKTPHTGYYAAVFGGMNLTQDSVIFSQDVTLGPTKTSTPTTGNFLTPMAGLKVGYVWPFDGEPIDQLDKELGAGRLRISGALEFEAYYLNTEVEATVPNFGADRFDLDSGVFSINAYLVGEVGKWRGYVGPGIGVAYVEATGTAAPAATGSSSSTNMAAQGIAGLEYFIKDDWSVFSEFKYLFLEGVGVKSYDFDDLEQVLMSVGIKKHF